MSASASSGRRDLREDVAVVGKQAVQKAEGFYHDFLQFINRGNVVDLAIGLMLGTAFGAIVSSLVSDIFSPILGLMGTASLQDLFIIMRYANQTDKATGVHYPTVAKAKDAGAITLNYGNFIQSIINFFIMALCLFFVIKFLFMFKRKKAAAAVPSTNWPCPKCRENVKLGAIRCPHCCAEPIVPASAVLLDDPYVLIEGV